ncbi:MAG: hypothetical protein L0220_32325, partial [Acidobacteria bacterium]|nr:hypothetical protein [Acidobacteriota bacterium]
DVCHEMPYWLSVIDFIEGKREDAVSRLEVLADKTGSGLFHLMTYALLCAFKGDQERGKQILDEVIASGIQLASYHYYLIAQIYAQLGDTENCLEMLRGALRTGYANYPFLISDPLFQPIRGVEGFAEIAKEMQKLQTQLQLMLVTG